MLLIKNGRVIDPARKKERNADIVEPSRRFQLYPLYLIDFLWRIENH